MTIGQIDRAIAEAQRFIAAARAARDRIVHQRGEVVVKPLARICDLSPTTGSRETGACRRASLDLTRALADLRRAER